MKAARWLTASGILVTLVGVVILIWIEAIYEDPLVAGYPARATYRFQLAGPSLTLIALGLLIITAAQILRVTHDLSLSESN